MQRFVKDISAGNHRNPFEPLVGPYIWRALRYRASLSLLLSTLRGIEQQNLSERVARAAAA